MAMRGVRRISVHPSLDVKPQNNIPSSAPADPNGQKAREEQQQIKNQKQANNLTSHNNEDSLFAGINGPKKIKESANQNHVKY
jgi:hypothetical protein